MAIRPISKRIAGYGLVLIVAILFTSLPTTPVRAGTIDQIMDNTLADFSDGNFQRSALSSIKDSDPPLKDDVGGVQLAPNGKLNGWGSSNPLPEAVRDAGLVALGKRLYVIGGTNAVSTTNAVHWATVTITNGNLLLPEEGGDPWQNPDPLPPTRYTGTGVRCSNREFAPRSDAAVTAVSTGGDTGYIYVIGGNVVDNGCTSQGVSSVAVQIGTVTTDGNITWVRSNLDFPTPLGDTGFNSVNLGNQDSAIANVRTINGKVFVYVFGGYARYLATPGGTTPTSVPTKAVIYSEVNLSDGSLIEWKRGPDIPVAGGSGTGLHGATAIAARFDVGGGTQATRDAIYLVGGKTSLTGSTYNERVFRADIDPVSGAITWDDTPGEGDKQVGLSPRMNLAGLSFNSKLYLIGGAPTDTAQSIDLVPTAVFLEDMSIDELEGQSNIFFQGLNPTDKVLLEGRQQHNVAIVRAQATTEEPSAAWVFVAGGRTPQGDLSSSLYLGKIGGLNEADENEIAPSGWYYSAPVSVRISNVDAQVLAVNWSTNIDRTGGSTADIRMEYRTAVTASGECNGQNIFTSDSWRVMTDTADPNLGSFFSSDGANSYDFEESVSASCFQYRAYITRTGTNTSPSLLNVSIKKIVPGSVDLKVKSVEATVVNGDLRGIKVEIENKNDFDDRITLPADLEVRGSFFVDLCISDVNQPLQIPTLPVTTGDGPPCSKAYAQVSRSQMTANAAVVVTGWYYASGPNIDQPIGNLISLFDQPGVYEIAAVIDGKNFVSEGNDPTSQQEQNNIGLLPPLQITITVPPSDSIIYLPMLRRDVP